MVSIGLQQVDAKQTSHGSLRRLEGFRDHVGHKWPDQDQLNGIALRVGNPNTKNTNNGSNLVCRWPKIGHLVSMTASNLAE